MVDHPVTHVLALFAISRAVTLLVLVVARVAPLPEPIDGPLSDLLCRWDCHWYLGIVADGYTAESPPASPDATPFAFFPLYPLVVAAVSAVTGLSPLTTGILLSSAFFAVALVYVYHYARDVGFTHRTGMLAVTLLAFAPPSVVFSSVFTDALFLLLLAAAVFHLRRGEPVRSAVAAALLTATRPNGIAFVLFALAWMIHRYGRGVLFRPWREPVAFLPVVIAPLGLFAFWTYSFAVTGDAFAHVSTNVHGWGWGSSSPLGIFATSHVVDPSDLVLMAISGVALAGSLLLLRYRLVPEFAMVLVTLAIYWTGGLAPWSMPRFALVLFPLAVVVARSVEARPGLATALVATAAMVNGFVLTVGWAMEAFVI